MVRINEEDRIKNRKPPLNPNDKTEINADNVMLIFDKIVNGEYRLKVKCLTYQEIVNLTDKEAGEVFFAIDIKQFLGWNGTELVVLG